MESVPTPCPSPDQLSVQELREIGLFGALSEQALQFLSASLKVWPRNAGDIIFREGDEARELYVIVRGEVEIFKMLKRRTDGRVSTLNEGHWFGEMSVLDVQRRSAS